MITTEKIKEHVANLDALLADTPDGPWKQEPHRVEFRYAGLQCLLSRSPMGNWCGYVGVEPGHWAHGKSYDDVEADVHGGLTYAAPCGGTICHIAEAGQPDDLWWLGFDCAHAFDLVPTMLALRRQVEKDLGMPTFGPAGFRGDVYRDVEYVKAETRRLAEQLAREAA